MKLLLGQSLFELRSTTHYMLIKEQRRLVRSLKVFQRKWGWGPRPKGPPYYVRHFAPVYGVKNRRRTSKTKSQYTLLLRDLYEILLMMSNSIW